MAQVMSYPQQRPTPISGRGQPSNHDLPRAYNPQTTPRRYEPYRSSISRRPTYPPPSINTLPPVPRPTPSPPPAFQTGPKNYDPLRPEGLYQASKGARRDIKWMRKHAEKVPQPEAQSSSPQRQSPPHAQPRPRPPPSARYGPGHANANADVHGFGRGYGQQGRPVGPYRTIPSGNGLRDPRASYPGAQISRPRRISAERMSLPTLPRIGIPPQPQPRISYDRGLRLGSGSGAGPGARPAAAMANGGDRATKERMGLNSARAQWVKEKQAQRKAEWERKVKRIQLQVFVHARPTPCPWGNCPALLNSWALLEKHLHHAHLHSQSHEMPPPGKPVRCKIKECDQVFGTGPECLQHCLSSHMGIYGARCPFNCAFEGEAFDSLMSHLGRRHRTATPDDFVPGLIHHFPPNLPSASALPKFPQSIESTPSPSSSYKTSRHSRTSSAGSGSITVKPQEEISPRVVGLVAAKCFSQKKPLPELYIRKQGALAAIAAIIDNAQREQLVTQANPTSDMRSPNHMEEEGEEELDPIDMEEGLYHSNPNGRGGQSSATYLLDLINVKEERKRAEKDAKARVKVLEVKGEMVSHRPKVHRFWTRSHTGSADSEDNEPNHYPLGKALGKEKTVFDYRYEVRHRRRLLNPNPISKMSLEVSEDSETEDTETDSASASSVCEPRTYKTTSRVSRTKRQKSRLNR